MHHPLHEPGVCALKGNSDLQDGCQHGDDVIAVQLVGGGGGRTGVEQRAKAWGL